ncbi:MAG: hypothetical protein ACLTLX_12770, partial [Ruthenibacterium lactatiformans]
LFNFLTLLSVAGEHTRLLALPSELHPHGTSAYQRRTLLSSALLYYQIISSLSTPNFQFFL